MIAGRAIGAGAFFVAVLLTGFWLSRLGRPLNSIVMAVHKLIGLGAGVFLVVTLVQVGRGSSLGAGVLAAAVVTGVGMVAGAGTGSVLSAKTSPTLLLRLHQAATFVSLASATALFCLLK